MVLSRTPLRISFVGGGSDLVSFTARHTGAVVSTTIDKYVYVGVSGRFEGDVRVSYSQTELVPSARAVEHDLVREALRHTGVDRAIEVVTVADVPGHGTGLGSSSAVTVGTLHALYRYLGGAPDAEQLAADASHIEIDVLGRPIGRQDQYACALGGLRLLRFGPAGRVEHEPLELPESQRRKLQNSLVLFYTSSQRSAAYVLESLVDLRYQSETELALVRIRDIALAAASDLAGGADCDVLGHYLHEHWRLKRRLNCRVSSPRWDDVYARAREAGALGGKLLGAGGGGFLMLYVPQSQRDDVRAALAEMREVPFALEERGSMVVLDDEAERAVAAGVAL